MVLDVDPRADALFQVARKSVGGQIEAIPVQFLGATRRRVVVLRLPSLETLDKFHRKWQVLVIDHAARGARSRIRHRPDATAAPLGPDTQEPVVFREEVPLHAHPPPPRRAERQWREPGMELVFLADILFPEHHPLPGVSGAEIGGGAGLGSALFNRKRRSPSA